MLKLGDLAPDFELEDADGRPRRLSEWKGSRIVLYFYPKDDTPGCTKEACGFRDRHGSITSKGAVVVGVSADKPSSHAKFAGKYELPFVLLSDPGHGVIEAYGAWAERKLYGRTFMGIVRSTYLIDAEGRIAKIWPKVSPVSHAEEIVEALDAL
ncbi:MAG TPA: thioredoxin-dependent thiol peroxidase [Rectinemataceae bacterium]|nr:thioredoxin-dependent thiol peroxidase [Rectinemataceae bacterium]